MYKTIHSGHMPLEITWTMKIAKKDGSLHMVKIAKTSDVSNEDLEDIDNLIKKYADTGVLEEMQKRPDSFLWCRARAIDADVPNENGDYFSEEELLAEVDAGKKGKIQAFKTFEGVPIYTNHKNDDIEQAKGKVIFAEWDNKEKAVYCTFFVDTEAYPQLARGIREGYIKDVSMGCSVDHSRCNICDNKAEKESEFCVHIKSHKGRKFSGTVDKGPRRGQRVTDEPVFEKNVGVKFIELSCVSDGAFENCEIEEVLPAERMVKSLNSTIIKESETMEKNIKEALLRDDIVESDELRNTLIAALNLSSDINKLVTSNGKLHRQSQLFPSSPRDLSPADELSPIDEGQKVVPVAGEVAPAEQPVGNPTDNTSSGMGIGINTLDALKDVIKNINTVIVTLLGTKGINLEHVRDLSKSVADIQDTIEDMIDSGSIDVSGSVPITNSNPTIQNNMAQQPAAPPPSGAPSYSTPQEGVGMQVGASSDGRMAKHLIKLNTLNEKLSRINKHQNKEEGGIMSDFKKLAATLREKQNSEKKERYEQEKNGFKIALASNGEISAYYRGVEVPWQPEVSEELIGMIDGGQIADATSDLLNQFSTAFADARKIQRIASVDAETPDVGTEVRLQGESASWPQGRLGNPGYPMENYIENVRKGMGGNRENDLAEVRKGIDERVKEHQLADRSVAGGELGRKGIDERVKEHQLEDLRVGVDVTVEENRLQSKRADANAATLVTAMNDALARAVVEARVSPEEVVESVVKLSSAGLADLLHEYSSTEHKAARETVRKRAKFYGAVKTASSLSVDSFVVGALADAVSDTVPVDGLVQVASELANMDKYAGLIGQIAKEKLAAAGDKNFHVASFEPDTEKCSEIRRQMIKAMIEKDETPVKLSRESIKSVVVAMATTIAETETSEDAMLKALASSDKLETLADIEIARDSKAVEARKTAKVRNNYWKTASTDEGALRKQLIANIADRTLVDGISAREAVDTIELLLSKKTSTKEAVASAMRKLQKGAATITDRSEREFSVCFRLEECGCSKEDPDVESRIREYIVKLFEGKGYQLSDPNTLSFTNLSISENGDVNGTIRSTVTRTFKAEAEGDHGMPEAVVSDRMMMARKQRRDSLEKVAQAMGADAANPGLAAPGGMAGGAGGDPAAAAGGADPGIASITGGGEPGASDEMGDEKTPEDSIPTPGQIAPPGAICPACGSMDTDVAESHGKCNDCGTEYDIKVNIEIANPDGYLKGSNNPEEGGEELGEELGEEMPMEEAAPGAGAAGTTPPGGGAAAGAMAPAGPAPSMPMAYSLKRVIQASVNVPVLVRLEWESDPNVFLKTAMAQKGKIAAVGAMAPGCVCPCCGEKENIVRVASSGKTNMHCDACGTIAVVDVNKGKGSSILNSITWVI